MSFHHNADLSPMNQNILSLGFSQDPASMTGADLDRHIDNALQTFGLGWSEDTTPCMPYNHCTSDVDNNGCAALGLRID